MKKSILLLAIATVLTMSGCAKSPAESNKLEKDVAFDTLELARATARENALFNAKLYVAENPRFDDHKVVSHGDSSQSPDCPQGDGWATVSIMKVEGKEIDKWVAKCSTVSGTLGCYLDKDFSKKPFSGDEGQCQPNSKVPFPLPKIAK